jgi:Flp pilus assembly protein TadD
VKRLLAWAAAAALSSAGAFLMLSSALRDARAHESVDVVVPRDASKIQPAELELIAIKIREGDLLAVRKDLLSARRAWAEARTLGRGLWPAHEGLADSYARNKLHADAEREYVTAEQLAEGKPRDVIRVKRARNLRAVGRDAEALDLLLAVNSPQLAREMVELADGRVDRLAERAANERWLWYVVHAAHAKAGRAPEAAKALARYVSEVAPWDRALVQRALEQLRAAKLVDEATAVCRAYAKSTPEDIAIWWTLGDLLAESGRRDDAFVAWTSTADLKPLDVDVRLQLASRLMGLGRMDDARAQFAAARKIKPDVQVPLEVILAEKHDLLLTMTWDTATDVDLYVTEPGGARVFYSNKRAAGVYHVDDTDGNGPEYYTCTPARGTYRVAARLHSGNARTNVRLVVSVRGTAREHTLVLERSGEEREIPAVVIE